MKMSKSNSLKDTEIVVKKKDLRKQKTNYRYVQEKIKLTENLSR